MNEPIVLTWIFFMAGFLCAACVIALQRESEKWRHLIQLYLEEQAGKALPIEPGPATGPVSELRIPKDLQAELDRRETDEGWI